MKSRLTMKLLPTLGLTILLLASGCATTVKIIPADREIKRVKSGVPFQSVADGWFVPDATWIEINDALGRELNSP